MKWQPIETAPKDGTLFWALCGFGGHSDPCIMMWHDGWEDWSDHSGAIVGFPTHWTPITPPEASL